MDGCLTPDPSPLLAQTAGETGGGEHGENGMDGADGDGYLTPDPHVR